MIKNISTAFIQSAQGTDAIKNVIVTEVHATHTLESVNVLMTGKGTNVKMVSVYQRFVYLRRLMRRKM